MCETLHLEDPQWYASISCWLSMVVSPWTTTGSTSDPRLLQIPGVDRPVLFAMGKPMGKIGSPWPSRRSAKLTEAARLAGSFCPIFPSRDDSYGLFVGYTFTALRQKSGVFARTADDVALGLNAAISRTSKTDLFSDRRFFEGSGEKPHRLQMMVMDFRMKKCAFRKDVHGF